MIVLLEKYFDRLPFASGTSAVVYHPSNRDNESQSSPAKVQMKGKKLSGYGESELVRMLLQIASKSGHYSRLLCSSENVVGNIQSSFLLKRSTAPILQEQ